jgi:predicted lipoprotein with Yx(FWY)xxD motif
LARLSDLVVNAGRIVWKSRTAPTPANVLARGTQQVSEEISVRIKLVTFGVALVLLLAACGSDSNDTSSTSGDNGNSSRTTEADESAADSNAVVKTADTDLGEVWVTKDGMTVYGFTADMNGTSSCTDACAQNWPPVAVDSSTLPSGLDDAIFTVITRPDGTYQLAAKNQPLYTFAMDESPGDTKGQGVINSWWVVKPDGSLDMTATAASGSGSSGGATTTTADDNGGGYGY